MFLNAISPLDNRYTSQLTDLVPHLSHYALIYYRVKIEIDWLRFQSQHPGITHVRTFTPDEARLLQSWLDGFDEAQARRVTEIERETNHDVKSVEYYIKALLEQTSLADVSEAVHFGCTSEDINNLSHALMLKNAIEQAWRPQAEQLVKAVCDRAVAVRDCPILAHTHGQPATPTTMGKELAVFAYRWQRQLKQLNQIEYLGKFNGASGNYNANVSAYPSLDWQSIARDFVESLGLTFNPITTQIDPHDYMAELFHLLIRFNTITLDFCRDMWTYISMGYFSQKTVANEVGSSTMPHKVNPINFENAEANVGISSALLEHLATKLPVSRLQRDLSDSSAIRNMGPAIAHSSIALQSALKGLAKTDLNASVTRRDLDPEWAVLGEAIQTVMRKVGIPNPYEQMKSLTRGIQVTQEDIRTFIEGLDLPDADRKYLSGLTPATYVGLSSDLVDHILTQI
ncbi:MAG: adenylosuccinate lyase [bacterium]|nr:adenylosuccinate lyase [bacterium]